MTDDPLDAVWHCDRLEHYGLKKYDYKVEDVELLEMESRHEEEQYALIYQDLDIVPHPVGYGQIEEGGEEYDDECFQHGSLYKLSGHEHHAEYGEKCDACQGEYELWIVVHPVSCAE